MKNFIRYDMKREKLNTNYMAKQIIALPFVDSSNKYVKENALRLQNGGTVFTLNQTQGRGRLDRFWAGEKGEMLAVSILLKLGEKDKKYLSQIPLVTSLALSKTISASFDLETVIKWPNDVLVKTECGYKKASGILCELFTVIDADSFIVIGVGVNFFQNKTFFEKKSLAHGTSVFSALYDDFEIENTDEIIRNFIFAFANNLEPLIDKVLVGKFELIKKEYESKCVTIGRDLKILDATGKILKAGKAMGINSDGGLVFHDKEKDEVEILYSGEVSVRGIDGYI